ncbi:hypothetical protein HDV00_012206 [Rhizophlyctis rosea]|nr:hypothetical protein HDV00_012206 [Rhizophlyctis rosea]
MTDIPRLRGKFLKNRDVASVRSVAQEIVSEFGKPHPTLRDSEYGSEISLTAHLDAVEKAIAGSELTLCSDVIERLEEILAEVKQRKTKLIAGREE